MPANHLTGPGIGGKALLKRREGSTPEEFRKHYTTHHASIVLPWCLANRVSYYAQVTPGLWHSSIRDL